MLKLRACLYVVLALIVAALLCACGVSLWLDVATLPLLLISGAATGALSGLLDVRRILGGTRPLIEAVANRGHSTA